MMHSRRSISAQARPLLAIATMCIAAPLPAQPLAAVDEPLTASFFKSSRDGWFWYRDPPPPPPPPASASMVSAPTAEPIDPDLAGMKAFQRRVQESLDTAVYNPNPSNVQRFLEIWAESRRKASTFEEIARVAAARMPWVDDTVQGVRPTNPAAQRVFDQGTARDNDALMRSLAQMHGIYFFFRSDCGYCHVFAPMLKQLERKYGFTVFAISMDGGTLPLYPHPRRDNGMAARVLAQLGIPEAQFQTPFTVLANPTTQAVLPVGFGAMTADEMVERISLLLRLEAQPPAEASTVRDRSAAAAASESLR